MATPRVSLTGTTFAKYPMSRTGRAPAARSKVGRIQRSSAPRPLPTDRTPTESSVSDGTGPTQIGASLPARWDASGVGCRFPWRTHGESAEYRRTGGNRKGGELTLADTRSGSGYQYSATRSGYALRLRPAARPVIMWRDPFTRRNGKRTTLLVPPWVFDRRSCQRANPARRYAASRPSAWLMFTNEYGHSASSDANHPSTSSNKRWPVRSRALTYFWKVPTASSSTASISRFSGWREASTAACAKYWEGRTASGSSSTALPPRRPTFRSTVAAAVVMPR